MKHPALALRLILVLGVAVASVASLGPGGFDPPEADTCPEPGAGTVTSIEVGDTNPDLFVARVDGQAVELTGGGQGATMLGVRFRLRGASVPECVSHRSSIHLCVAPGDCSPTDIAVSTAALRTYAEIDGSRTTKTHWLIMEGQTPDYGAPFELRSTVAGQSVVMTFWYGLIQSPDAAPPDAASLDAGSPDAMPPADATTSADAMP